jgi:outer membrane protein OmpA-like peptidoglycan-associated protein
MPKLTLLRRSPRKAAFWPDFDPIHMARIFFLLAAALSTLAVVGVRPLAAQSSSSAMIGTSVPDSSGNKVLNASKDDIRIENLKDLNSLSDDATTFVSPADGSIYFTSSRSGKQVLYVAKRLPASDAKDHTAHWSAPEVYAALPEMQNISSLSIAADGVTAVLGICNRPDGVMQSCDIYQGQIIDGKLDNLTSLGAPINTEWWEAQPCISQDGQLLFFASDRKGGHGGSDIYMCSKSVDGKWGAPVNLSFNTGGNEMSPFIASDNQTLYFASDHLPGGMGGFDIYVTHRQGENEWTEPKNLGPAINSKNDDLFFCVPQNEDAVYFSSDRAGGEGGYDLYRVYVQPKPPQPKYVTLTGRILDAETNQPISTAPEIAISFSNNGQALDNEATGPAYSVKVLAGSLVHISAGAQNYVSNALEIQAPSTDAQPVMTQDISLAPSHARIFGHVINSYNKAPLKATVVLEQMAGGVPAASAETDPTTGAYSFNVNPLISYRISTKVPNYQPYEDKIDVPAAREKLISIEKEIRLTPEAVQGFMVFFDVNKYDIKPEDFAKFPDFIRQVKENPEVRFEIDGHTDSTGSEALNQTLSENRAKAVEDYLLNQGVPREQIAVVQGFGKSQPLDPNNLARNRRVEVQIVGRKD